MSGSESPPFDFVKFFEECHLWFCFLLFAFLPKEACFQYAAFPIQTVHSQSSFFLSCQPAFNSIGLIFSYPLRYLLIKYRIFFYCLRIVHFLLNIVCCYFYPFLIGSFSSFGQDYAVTALICPETIPLPFLLQDTLPSWTVRRITQYWKGPFSTHSPCTVGKIL